MSTQRPSKPQGFTVGDRVSARLPGGKRKTGTIANVSKFGDEWRYFGRGRDADYSTPPAQIRTCAFTHTALTVDAWRQKRKSNCSPHTAQSLGHALPRSVSGTCKIERCSPQSAPFPPQPPQKVTLRCSVGSWVLRHSPTSPERSCPPFGLWPSRTGLRLSTKASRRSPGSRACCFSACAGS